MTVDVPAPCDGSATCPAQSHVHGCFAERRVTVDVELVREIAGGQRPTGCLCKSCETARAALALCDELDRTREEAEFFRALAATLLMEVDGSGFRSGPLGVGWVDDGSGVACRLVRRDDV